MSGENSKWSVDFQFVAGLLAFVGIVILFSLSATTSGIAAVFASLAAFAVLVWKFAMVALPFLIYIEVRKTRIAIEGSRKPRVEPATGPAAAPAPTKPGRPVFEIAPPA